MRQENHGFTLWFTGLSGAGKSTIAEIVVETEGRTPEDSAQHVIDRLEELGFIAARQAEEAVA